MVLFLSENSLISQGKKCTTLNSGPGEKLKVNVLMERFSVKEIL